uniref:CUB domain-containing protein n=1 Tax=Plectus sambesii TaxID=2011161 RepID=A0A914WBR9_9BILA
VTSAVNCKWTITNEIRVRIRVTKMPMELLKIATVTLELHSSNNSVRLSFDNSTLCPIKESSLDEIPCLNDDTWTMMTDGSSQISISLTIVPYKDGAQNPLYGTIQLGYFAESSSCGNPFYSMDDSVAISFATNTTQDCVYYVKKESSPSALISILRSGSRQYMNYQLSIYGGSSTYFHSALYQPSDFNPNTDHTTLHSSSTVTTIRFVLSSIKAPSNRIYLVFQQHDSADSHRISASSDYDWIASSAMFPTLTAINDGNTESWVISGSPSSALEIHYFVPQAYDDGAFTLDAYYGEYSQKPDDGSNMSITQMEGFLPARECGQSVTIFLTRTTPFRGFSFWAKEKISDVTGLSCSYGIESDNNSFVAITVGVILGGLLLFGLFGLALYARGRWRPISSVSQSARTGNRVSIEGEQPSLSIHNAWYGQPETFLPSTYAGQEPMELLPPPPYEDALKMPTSPAPARPTGRPIERRNNHDTNDAGQENSPPPGTVEYDTSIATHD